MPDTIATPTRELAYLGAAAGNNDAPANPARLEEQLYAKMAARISALEQSSGGGGGSFPAPTSEDVGKVLTAGADGTASWEAASGGGGLVTYTILYEEAQNQYEIVATAADVFNTFQNQPTQFISTTTESSPKKVLQLSRLEYDESDGYYFFLYEYAPDGPHIYTFTAADATSHPIGRERT